MKKRFILTTLLLAALFALCMSAYAADPYPVWVGGEQITDSNLTVNGGTGTATYDPDTATLTLDNYSYTGEGYEYTDGYTAAICANQALNIVLKGNNSLTCAKSSSDGITACGICTDGDVSISGSGTVNITVTATSTADNAATEAYGIFAFGGVSISGGTVKINVTSTSTAYTTARGIFARTGDVTISGGRVDITATASGSNSGVAVVAYGIDGDVNITGGRVNIDVKASGSNNSSAYGINANDASISGGMVNITATSSSPESGSARGINAYANSAANNYGTISITGGRVDITATATASGSNTPYAYGLHANNVSISGGTVDITASATASGSNNSIAYGIFVKAYANASGTISITDGVTTIDAGTQAFNKAPTLTNTMDYLMGTVFTDKFVVIGAESLQHVHNFYAYAFDATHHWHPCTVEGCYLSLTYYEKQTDGYGYGPHNPSDDCTTCDYTTTADVWVGGMPLQNGKYVSNDGIVTPVKPTGGYAHLKDGTLTLSNYDNDGAVYTWGKYNYTAAIYSKLASLTIKLEGENTLTNPGNNDGYSDSGIYATGDVTISGGGKVTIDAGDDDGYGIAANDGVTISGATVDITSGKHGISADDVTITDGKVTIDASGKYGIYATGSVTITNSAVDITVNFHLECNGIDAYGSVTIKDSTVNIAVTTSDTLDSSAYGIDAYGGVMITDSTAGITVTGENSQGIWVGNGNVAISGGKVTITATGTYSYGVYTNGNVTISGGEVDITTGGSIGISADAGVTISGGSGTIVGTGQALWIGAVDDEGNSTNTGVLTVGSGVDVLGSENSDGTGAAAYDETKRTTYKYISFVTVAPAVPADPSTPTITNPIPENATVSDDGTVTVPAEGGSVSYPATFGAGETVVVTVTPDEHEKIASVVINGVEMGTSGVYVIENVTEALDIRVIFVKAQSFIDAVAGQEPSEPEVPAYAGSALRFYDVMPYNSAYDAINFVADRGIMNGTGVGQFSPEAALTRSMMATILWRMEGEPTVWYGGQFSDVKGGQWYSTPIAWANAAGIVEGYGNGVFGLNDSLTHGQLCAMLYRWNTRSYGDIDTAWAWAQANGLYDDLAGVSADEAATRAGIAEVLMAFVTRVW